MRTQRREHLRTQSYHSLHASDPRWLAQLSTLPSLLALGFHILTSPAVPIVALCYIPSLNDGCWEIILLICLSAEISAFHVKMGVVIESDNCPNAEMNGKLVFYTFVVYYWKHVKSRHSLYYSHTSLADKKQTISTVSDAWLVLVAWMWVFKPIKKQHYKLMLCSSYTHQPLY